MQAIIQSNIRISTHSLTRRLTDLFCSKRNYKSYFNSQPHKEADILYLWRKVGNMYFNSQPHKEADTEVSSFFVGFGLFQLTASQGG